MAQHELNEELKAHLALAWEEKKAASQALEAEQKEELWLVDALTSNKL